MAAQTQAARLMILNAAWMMDTMGHKEARQQVSLIKFYAAGILQDVMDKALQVHGGLGMSDDTVIASFYRGERAARIYDGVDEVHKMSVAKRIIKEYKAQKGMS